MKYWTLVGVHAEFGQAFQHDAIERLQLDPGKVRTKAAMRSCSEDQVVLVFAPEIE